MSLPLQWYPPIHPAAAVACVYDDGGDHCVYHGVDDVVKYDNYARPPIPVDRMRAILLPHPISADMTRELSCLIQFW